jgi:hypothetical protein
MNFWKQLRLIGSVIVLLVAVMAIVMAVLRKPDVDADRPDGYPNPAIKALSGTTGL